VEQINGDATLSDRASTSKIRLLVLMVLFCERLMGDRSSGEHTREQAAQLYDQWVCFLRHDQWFSDSTRPQRLSAEGEALTARMKSFIDGLVDRLPKIGAPQLRLRRKNANAPEGQLVGRAVAIIEEKGRRVLLAMTAHIGGK
jgi:hypothetical protein